MSESTTATDGATVRVHYTGKLDDGTVFDSSAGRDPLEFTLGGGQVIPGFEAAVEGMAIGGYGPRRDDLVMEIGRTQIPDDIDVQIGSRLQLTSQDGRAVPVTVTELSDDSVTLDANHPLAGETLNFELELVSVD